ncbi:hypothetical protein VTH82DRAFT_6097 [Thermothelomyces myriococcoides]
MASPANAAVRENRRQTTPLELERMNVSKALTAAEHSRRQFILNFAATRNTQLLIPGRKSDAVKVAEEWAAVRLRQNGHPVVKDEFFRYTVDARLWETHVGNDIDFPFAFMGRPFEPSESDSTEADDKRPDSEPSSLDAKEIEAGQGDVLPAMAPSSQPTTPAGLRSPRKPPQQRQQSAPSTPVGGRQRSITHSKTYGTPLRDRSMSLTSFDAVKSPKVGQEKIPLLARLGRSWSRRLS